MKKIIYLALILLALTIIYQVPATAQTPIRIQFAKGKNTATIKGSTGPFGIRYVIKAKSGQKLVLNLSPTKPIGIKVETNGSYGEMVLLEEQQGGTYEIGLEESGDYTIFIGSTRKVPTSFTLTVKITKLADI
jgi:hypothetical protein